MPHMPYVYYVGEAFAALAEYGNDEDLNAAGEVAGVANLLSLRSRLLASGAQAADVFAALVKPRGVAHRRDSLAPAAFLDHLKEHWFDHPHNPAKWNSGWWVDWRGNPDRIVCETVLRTTELALGIAHGAPDTTKGTRHWKTRYIWTCGAPMFQGWISWWAESEDEGYITTVLTTPGNGQPLYADVAGQLHGGLEGSWVVGQAKNTKALTSTALQPMAAGAGFISGMGRIESTGNVVACSPSVDDGGVRTVP